MNENTLRMIVLLTAVCVLMSINLLAATMGVTLLNATVADAVAALIALLAGILGHHMDNGKH
jgi:hypothetical protein